MKPTYEEAKKAKDTLLAYINMGDTYCDNLDKEREEINVYLALTQENFLD